MRVEWMPADDLSSLSVAGLLKVSSKYICIVSLLDLAKETDKEQYLIILWHLWSRCMLGL
jgi:hypothetical protein